MITVTRHFEFEACHHLPHYRGACHNVHGHSYKLSVTVTGDINRDVKDPCCGMIIDFKDLKDVVNNIIEKYDHSDLNEYFPNPTAEIMVDTIAQSVKRNLKSGLKLVSVKLWETSNSYAEWTE